MKLRRRQLILASLVLALGAAVYLNWQFSDDKGLAATDVLRSPRELGEARYVNNSKSSDGEDREVEQVSSMASETKEYFAKARIDRQKSRDEATETIKKTLSDSSSDDRLKNDAAEKVGEITKAVQQESNIENLIKAKGFGECLAFIQNGECSVVVSPGNLNDGTLISIRDAVYGQAGIPFDKIKIVEAK